MNGRWSYTTQATWRPNLRMSTMVSIARLLEGAIYVSGVWKAGTYNTYGAEAFIIVLDTNMKVINLKFIDGT